MSDDVYGPQRGLMDGPGGWEGFQQGGLLGAAANNWGYGWNAPGGGWGMPGTGNPQDDEYARRQGLISMGASMGSTLLGMAQGGLTMPQAAQQRVQGMERLGQTAMVGQQAQQQAYQGLTARLQAQQQREEMEADRALQAYLRRGLPGSAGTAPGAVPGAAPPGVPPGAPAPAPGPVAAEPLPPVPGAPARDSAGNPTPNLPATLPPGQAGFTPQGLATNTRSESGNNPNARPTNPDGSLRSSALGPNQFIDDTWMQFAQQNPALFPPNLTRNETLALRTNRNLSERATQWYAGRNAPHLQSAGVPVNDATLALAHQFDGPVAARIATAPPNTPVDQIVGAAAMNANRQQLGGGNTGRPVVTAGELVQNFQGRYPGTSAPALAGSPQAPRAVASAPPAASGEGTWWGALNLTPDQALLVANLPRQARQAVMSNILATRATAQGAAPHVFGDRQGGYFAMSRDGQVRPLVGPQSGIAVNDEVARQEGTLRGEFRQATEGFDTRQQAFLAMRQHALDTSGASDIAMIFSFFKTIDPTSTVREGEAASARNAASVPERFRAMYNRLLTGEQLGDTQRQDIIRTAGREYEQAYDSYTRALDRFGGLARSYGGDPNRVITDSRDTGLRQGIEGERQILRSTPEQIGGMSREEVQRAGRLLERMNPAQRAAVAARLRELVIGSGGP